MSKTTRHGPRGAVVQALQTGAGRARGDGRGAGGGQRVGEVTLPPDLPPKSRGLVHLGQRREIHDVIVAVRAEVGRALAGLVAVLQQNGGSGFIRSPRSLIVDPLPEDSAAEARGLSKQGTTDRTCLSWWQKRFPWLSHETTRTFSFLMPSLPAKQCFSKCGPWTTCGPWATPIGRRSG